MIKNDYRAVAEFEPQESVLLTWPGFKYAYRDEYVSYDVMKVALTIIKELQPVVKVIIQALGYDHEEIKTVLKDNSIPLDNIEIVDFSSDYLDVNLMPLQQPSLYFSHT